VCINQGIKFKTKTKAILYLAKNPKHAVGRKCDKGERKFDLE